MAREKIVVTHTGQLNEDLLAFARKHAPDTMDLQILPGKAPADVIAAAIRDAHYLLGYVEWIPDEAFVEAKSLKLVQVISAGYDLLNIKGIGKAGIPVCTNGGANAVAVAEHTLLLMLAVYKQLIVSHRSVTAGQWLKGVDQRHLYEIDRKTVGLIGLGNIGRHVVKRVKAFDPSDVLYFDVFRQSEAVEKELGVTHVPFEQLLERCDIVSLHMPLNEHTRGMIGARELARMKPTAIIINTCRGEIIDEPALIEALKARRLLGAGLDTLAAEPPALDNPLLRMDSVTLSPHSAGPTFDSFEKRFINSYANIRRVANGERPHWIIPEMKDLKLRMEG